MTSNESSPRAKKSFWRRYGKRALIAALVLAIAGVILEDSVLNILAHFTHTHGVGYWFAAVAASFLFFVINFLVCVIGIAVLSFIGFIAVLIFGPLFGSSRNNTTPNDAPAALRMSDRDT